MVALVIGFIGLMGATLGGCAGGGSRPVETALSAPPNANPAAAAANLDPGNKLIWSSPALREHGEVLATPKSGDFFTLTSGHH